MVPMGRVERAMKWRTLAGEAAAPVAVFAGYLALMIGLWRPDHLVLHDTFDAYVHFQRAYSHWLLTHRTLQWLAYTAFGVPSYVGDLTTLPAGYRLMMLAGAAAHINDALALFKGALLLQAGVY